MRIRVAIVLAIVGTSGRLAAQDNTKIVDKDTKFHRLYVLGNGNNSCEDESFMEDQMQLRDVLETPDNQANGSTSQTLTKPTLAEFQQALNNIKNNARAGDEVTLYFGGHGGHQTFADATEGNEPDNGDEHFRLSAGNRLTDDALSASLQGLPADVTLLILMDTCYGGGFTGGGDDVAEGSNVKVVGTKGTCPIEPWSDLLKWWTTTLTDSIVDSVTGGAKTGNDVKSGVENDGFELGPPEATTGNPKHGKAKCDDCTGLPKLTMQEAQDASTPFAVLSGTNFGAGAFVDFFQVTGAQDVIPLGFAITDDSGSFSDEIVELFAEQPYLIVAQDDQGYEDWVEVPELIFSNGFESGDVSAWTLKQP